MDRLRCLASGAGRATRPLALFALLVVTAGCGGSGGGKAGVKLVDGSNALPVPPSLGKLAGTVVMARTRLATARQLSRALLRACLGELRPASLSPREPLVQRKGVLGSSLTFRGRPPGWIRGCDASAGPTESGRPWCAAEAGRERPDGRLYDSRLNMGCLDGEGRQIGFAWIDPLPETRYIAVEGRDLTEVYDAAGGLPVRLTTSDVRVEGSSATFSLTQYAADGSRLSHETVRATVTG